MSTKLNMGQLFVDMLALFRRNFVGLLPWLLIAIISVAVAKEVLRTEIGGLPSGALSFLVELVVMSAIGALIYRRGMSVNTPGGVASNTWSLALGQGLVFLLFAILAGFALMFLALLTGIMAAAAGLDPSVDGFEASDISAAIESLGGLGQIILGVLSTGGVLGFTWLAARLVVFGAATVAEGQLMIFRTWRWTQGHALRIAIFCAVIYAPIALAYLGVFASVADAEIGAGGSGQFLRMLVITTPMTLAAFLVGHLGALAIYAQIGPKPVDHEQTFS